MKTPEELLLLKSEKEKSFEEMEKLLPLLKNELKIEAEMFQNSNFPVDDNLRINPEKFENVFSKESIKEHQKIANAKKIEFEKSKKPENAAGELLENAKTLAINRFWFRGRFLAVRTSLFDDYKNGIDEIIVSKESSEVVAAIDTTTDYQSKAEKLTNLLKEGGKIDYGLKYKDGKVALTELEKLPVFIISFNSKEVLNLSRAVLDHKIPEAEEIKLKKSLIAQAKIFSQNASLKMRPAYEKALKTFENL